MQKTTFLLIGVFFLSFPGIALSNDDEGAKGLNPQARQELADSGASQYLGQFTPATSTDVGDGWTKHTYAPNYPGDGPLCIAGTPYSVFTKSRDPKNLLIFMQGGGACWQDFYFCNILSEDQEPPPEVPLGIWDDSVPAGMKDSPNPLADYSIVYMPYCDGSVFTGDNDVLDPNFPFGPVRFHRGLENASAGIDMAKTMFPKARRILVAGSSAGGVGAASFAPLLTRMVFGNEVQLSVFNDAGPVAVDLNDFLGGIPLRAADWLFGQFYPASCTDCSDLGQQTALIKWRLDNDSTVRESFYSTDGDATDRFFLGVPTQEMYRYLIVTEHGLLNAAHPDRYKRF
ncbi:MAG: pectinacetylesterase family protein, partial [Gammaproteobacteria bacterium]|nr:pectinacetylesterase family protein [Gammaproteobacteria bacterium]